MTGSGHGSELPGRVLRGRVLIDGEAAGPALVLEAPLSLWGGWTRAPAGSATTTIPSSARPSPGASW
jgi:hypothetical protein